MKKHKSVVAILLAVMMIFTMMPMMAFAEPATGWATDYSTVTDGKGTYKAEREFNTTYGYTTATATDKYAEQVVGQSDGVAPTGKDGEPAVKYFYDAEKVDLGADVDTKLEGSKWTQAAFGANEKGEGVGLASKIGFILESPKYVKDYNATKPAKAFVKNFGAGYTVEVKTEGFDPKKTTIDQTVKVDVTISVAEDAKIDGDSAATAEMLIPRTYTANITVKGIDKTWETANFYFDTVGGTLINDKVMYDGAAHTVVCDEVPGYTVSYQVYNPTTGKYENAASVSITDVQEKDMDVKAIFKKGDATETRSLKVNLLPATGAEIAFDENASTTDPEYGINYSVPGEKYDAAGYVVVNPVELVTSGRIPDPEHEGQYIVIDDQTRAANKVKNAATAKAVAANQALLKEYFNDFFMVQDKATKTNPSIINLTIVDKDLTQAEATELGKKYAALKRNFGQNIDVYEGAKANVYLNGGVFDYEVEFTKAPVGAKVIHIKKAKSLKKAKSFTVKAIANNGYTVYYKLINANSKIKINKTTGKITLSKGLKKGTYKFQVKAYVPGVTAKTGTGYWETQNITVKVKK